MTKTKAKNKEKQDTPLFVPKDKYILDACCGGRTFWFDKKHQNTLYMDLHPRDKGVCNMRPNFSCEPDVIYDFTNTPFEDKSFKHIVWDPPHLLNLQERSIMFKKYGSLYTETWQQQLKDGFKELWRVLDDYGTLVFKWCESSIELNKVLKLFPEDPLYGHPTAKSGKTKWMVFMKIPKREK